LTLGKIAMIVSIAAWLRRPENEWTVGSRLTCLNQIKEVGKALERLNI